MPRPPDSALPAFAEQRRVAAALDRLSIPTLVIHGGDDTLVPTATSAVLEGPPGVTRQRLRGLRHERHNEPEAAIAMLDAVGRVDAGPRRALEAVVPSHNRRPPPGSATR